MKKPLVLLAVLLLLGGNTFAANGDLTVNGNFNLLPAGTMVMYGGAAAPGGWLLADGSAVSRTTYATLFAAIGTTYGAGDDSTTFNLPDFRRRVAVGAGGTGTATLGNAVGNKGGEESHTLTIAEMPAHSHTGTVSIPAGPVNADSIALASNASAGGPVGYSLSINNAGSGGAHNNLQPSLVVNYIIKY